MSSTTAPTPHKPLRGDDLDDYRRAVNLAETYTDGHHDVANYRTLDELAAALEIHPCPARTVTAEGLSLTFRLSYRGEITWHVHKTRTEGFGTYRAGGLEGPKDWDGPRWWTTGPSEKSYGGADNPADALRAAFL